MFSITGLIRRSSSLRWATAPECSGPPILSIHNQPRMKRIAVVGPIPRDHIMTHQGDLIQKWGCVTHPVIALSVMAGDQIEIIPVSHVRNVDLDNVREVFKGHKGINLDHITCKNDQGDLISLKFVDVNSRLEKQTGFMDP